MTKPTGRIFPLFLLTVEILLGSCEPVSVKDYQMEPYSGAFSWEVVTKKAAWRNRVDHAAVSFNGKMWLFGGYEVWLMSFITGKSGLSARLWRLMFSVKL